MEPESKQETTRTFGTDIKINWYRCPIDKKVIAGLMKRNDFRGWVQTVCHLGLYFVTGALTYFVFTLVNASNWFWTVPLLLVALWFHGIEGPFMQLIAVHEMMHRTVFKSKALNEFFEKVYAFISWSDYLWYQRSHIKHHQATTHYDYDGEVTLPLTFAFSNWRFWLGTLFFNPVDAWNRLKTVVLHATTGRLKDDWYNFVLPESNPDLRKKHRNWARTLLIGHSLLALVFILTGHWFLIFVFTFGTFYSGWLGLLMGAPQHYGLTPNVSDFRLNTRTFTCSWLPAFYYWNMQYHMEHHMFPAVPFYNLPKLRQAIIDDVPPATHGLRATWKQMMEIHRNYKADPNYTFVPELPQRDGSESTALT